MKAIFAALWGAVLFVHSLPSSAMPIRDDTEARSIKVDYSDLDLAHERGVKTLEGRVRGAVRQVCANGDLTLAQKSAQRACESTARTKAAEDVSSAVTRSRQFQQWKGEAMQPRDWRDDIAPKHN